MEGMRLLRRLAFYHSDTLQGKLPEVCLCLSHEVFQLVGFSLVYILNQSPLTPDID